MDSYLVRGFGILLWIYNTKEFTWNLYICSMSTVILILLQLTFCNFIDDRQDIHLNCLIDAIQLKTTSRPNIL